MSPQSAKDRWLAVTEAIDKIHTTLITQSAETSQIGVIISALTVRLLSLETQVDDLVTLIHAASEWLKNHADTTGTDANPPKTLKQK